MEKESPLHSKFLHFLIFLSSPVCAGEFLYPVGADPHQSLIYLIYQKTPSHIELWGWNPKTKQAQQMLLSRLTPAGFQMLPDGRSFSFIDQGLLKIKQLVKRSPRTIEFDAPLYNVELVHWIDVRSCYTHGKYADHFGLFHISLDGDVSPLCMKDKADCLYPQKVADELFYIERDERWRYRIMKTAYRVSPVLDSFCERRAWYEAQQHDTEMLIDFAQRPIVFLRMVSEKKGFVIEHDRAMSRRDQSVEFSYHRIEKQESGWSSERLFRFSVPARFLFLGKQDRFYEALLPLLPRQIGERILYVDAVNRDLGLFRYDLTSSTTHKVLASDEQSFFAPILWKEQLLSGGSLGDEIRMEPTDFGVQVRLVGIPFKIV